MKEDRTFRVMMAFLAFCVAMVCLPAIAASCSATEQKAAEDVCRVIVAGPEAGVDDIVSNLMHELERYDIEVRQLRQMLKDKDAGARDAAPEVGTMKGQTRYRLAHWGERGKVSARELSCADPRAGELVELGTLVEVVYLTRKGGDAGPTEYEHRFANPRPVLAWNDTGLVICGGRYRITMRGIVG